MLKNNNNNELPCLGHISKLHGCAAGLLVAYGLNHVKHNFHRPCPTKKTLNVGNFIYLNRMLILVKASKSCYQIACVPDALKYDFISLLCSWHPWNLISSLLLGHLVGLWGEDTSLSRITFIQAMNFAWHRIQPSWSTTGIIAFFWKITLGIRFSLWGLTFSLPPTFVFQQSQFGSCFSRSEFILY